MTGRRSFVARVYAWLLRVSMPRPFVEELEDPMVSSFEDLYRSAKEGGGRVRFLWGEGIGLLLTALTEHRLRWRARKRGLGRRSAMGDLCFQNAKYALRSLLQRPGVSFLILVTMALGIGATTATFSVVKAVLLEPLAYREPDRLTAIFNRWEAWDRPHDLSVPELIDYRERAESFESIGAFFDASVNLTGLAGGASEPERLAGYWVTANLFPLLGVEPQLGRQFTVEEERRGAPAVILSHELFSRRFGARPETLGSSVLIDGESRIVTGVMPPEFRLPRDLESESGAELYLVAPIDPADPGNRGAHGIAAVGRLRDGVALSEASAELDAVARSLTEEGLYKEAMNFSTYAVALEEDVVGRVRAGLFFLLGAVGFVLLVAAANVANLLLVRSESRHHEIAVRTALGAGRGRIAGQLLMESSLLALGGALLGLGLAAITLKLFVLSSPGGIPRLAAAGIDASVLTFTAATMVATGLLVGLWPAVRLSNSRMERAWKNSSRIHSGRSPSRFLSSLAVAQIALAAILSIGAVLMMRSFQELVRIDVGFRPQRVLTFRLALPSSSYPDPQTVASFYERLRASLKSVPGVAEAGAVRSLPLATRMGTWNIDIEDKPLPEGQVRASAHWQLATAGYLETMGIPILSGRGIEEVDRIDSLPVVVVNQRFAERHWPDGTALGKRIRVGRASENAPWLSIVGVVGNVRHNGVTEEVHPRWYLPHGQWPLSRSSAWRDMSVVMRLSNDTAPLEMVPTVRSVLRDLDPELPLSSARSMEDVVATTMLRPHFLLSLLGSFAALALLIASVGVYGVLAHSVSRRTQEIGLRMALGADRAGLIRLVLRQALLVSSIGIGAGLALAAGLTRLITGFLYGVGEHDPFSFLMVPVIITAVTLLASLAPAARASRVDPLRALAID